MAKQRVDRGRIRVKAFAVIYDEDRTHHAVSLNHDPAKGQDFHRLLGGGVELGERAEEAVVREIDEELGAGYLDVRRLGVLANIFTFDGERGHAVVFVYDGRLDVPGAIPARGGDFFDNGIPMRVEWRPVDDAEITIPLYPDGVADLLEAAPDIPT